MKEKILTHNKGLQRKRTSSIFQKGRSQAWRTISQIKRTNKTTISRLSSSTDIVRWKYIWNINIFFYKINYRYIVKKILKEKINITVVTVNFINKICKNCHFQIKCAWDLTFSCLIIKRILSQKKKTTKFLRTLKY